MKRGTALVLLLLVSHTLSQNHERRVHGLDLIKLLNEKPWTDYRYQNSWDLSPDMNSQVNAETDSKVTEDSDEGISTSYDNGEISVDAEKRSAVATALNAGRRRRQPTPALGKAVTPYVGVGVLNDMGSFFDALRDNLDTLASLSPQQRSTLFQDPPHVLQAPSAGMSGGGSGMRKLHALRPLRPAGNIRSYNRRSFGYADGVYPAANHHDPGLLWTGLGRR